MTMKMPDLKQAIVVNKKNGKQYHVNDWDDLKNLAIDLNAQLKRKKQLGGMVYTDMENFAYGMDGKWYLMDECGNFEALPEDRYEIRLPEE